MFASYDLVTEEVRGRPLNVFRDRPRSLRELLDASLSYGDREYIVDGDRRISYAEHHAAVERVAAWLAGQGVGKGDRVAILGRNSIEWVVTFWATVSLGAIAVALNTWWSDAEIAWAVEHSEPTLVVDDMDVLAALVAGPADRPDPESSRLVQTGSASLRSGFAHGAPVPGPDGPPATRTDVDEDDPAVILYTSGTTGRPKGATHSHRNVVCLTQAQQYLAYERIQGAIAAGLIPEGFEVPPPRVLTSTPLFHVSGLHSGVVAMLVAGGTTIWVPGRFDPMTTMRAIERERATQWTSMPTTVWRLVNHPHRHHFDLSSMRHVGGGGAAWSPALQEKIRETFGEGVTWGIGYGLTECTGLATTASFADMQEDPTTVGRPVATVEVKVVPAASDDRAAEAGTSEGEICIRGPMVMLGYWNDPTATAKVIDADGWLHSGDLGEIDTQGRLRLAARRSDLILRGAENVYPAEVENCLEGHPAVAEVAVVGLRDEEFGQIVAAVVVPEQDAAADPADLTEWAKQRLGYYKVPTQWFIRSEPLPRTATGKVIRDAVFREAEKAQSEETT